MLEILCINGNRELDMEINTIPYKIWNFKKIDIWIFSYGAHSCQSLHYWGHISSHEVVPRYFHHDTGSVKMATSRISGWTSPVRIGGVGFQTSSIFDIVPSISIETSFATMICACVMKDIFKWLADLLWWGFPFQLTVTINKLLFAKCCSVLRFYQHLTLKSTGLW